ncbi:MAG: HD domain-containing protein [Lentisphaeraceae bacterium]|nr:HD domain-containing protein [Lentisphaeraceae bacterium]
MNFVKTAEEIATKAHEGQFRKGGEIPYIIHPQRVSKRVKGDPDAEAVAWLHDVLEDTDVTAEILRSEGIPDNVIEAVKALTKSKEIPYNEYLENVRNNELAKKVKIQDMLDNLSDNPSNKQIIKYSKGFLVLLRE